ncbi:MAG: aminomethyl transferase family protein [Actinobacteria bacterium]|nr:aminomethyl transferase family protein [Actinomycetota bacterium]
MMLISTDASVKAQHDAVRNFVGFYDFTHKLLEVTGEDAAAFLDYIFVADIANLAAGKARYTTMLDEKGLIIDDVIVFHLADGLYWVSTLFVEELIRWLDAHKKGYAVKYKNITDDWKMYSIQGPKAKELVNVVVESPVDDLKFFSIVDNSMGDAPVKVARSGYTGEKVGYEIYIAADNVELLESKLASEAEKIGGIQVTEVDVMAYTLATEAGFILMTDVLECNPFEVGFEKTVNFDKDFIGKSALELICEVPPSRTLLGFTVEDDEARIYGGWKGHLVLKGSEKVGRVTKYTRGFTAGKNIGYALVETAKAKVGDTVTISGVPAVLTDRNFI